MSSDIRWLPLSLRKNIDTPRVIYEPYNDEYGGYHVEGTKDLVVVEDEIQAHSTIAHEYCHYLQYIRGATGKDNNMQMFSKFSYNKAIRLYFRTMRWEMEALLFQDKYAPTDVTRFWLRALVLPSDSRFQEDICM